MLRDLHEALKYRESRYLNYQNRLFEPNLREIMGISVSVDGLEIGSGIDRMRSNASIRYASAFKILPVDRFLGKVLSTES